MNREPISKDQCYVLAVISLLSLYVSQNHLYIKEISFPKADLNKVFLTENRHRIVSLYQINTAPLTFPKIQP